jgi:hypothetical protein
MQETTLQKRRIAELESQLTSRVTHRGRMPDKTQKKVQPEKRPKSKSPISAPRDQRGDSIPRHTSPQVEVRSSLSFCNLRCIYFYEITMDMNAQFCKPQSELFKCSSQFIVNREHL